MSRVFAYCRVSTADQHTENQIAEIKAAGFEVTVKRTISEHISGSVPVIDRPGFQKLLDRIEEGDVLVVTKLDRLGRNAIDVQQTVRRLADTGVRVHCLALGGVDLTSSAGKMTMGVLTAVAQFERDLLIERTQAGLQRVRAEGRKLGRPSALSQEQQVEVRQRLAHGATIYALAKEYGVARQVIMRVRDRAASA
ncbi:MULTISPECIES: recombinase family protein [unclassified Burkholderia]|uniref:recombinase family protein n=1 Tax=unclassified Burkholderia TaxID=2613784 RepID=UPI001420016E|nr:MULTISPECIES: recombinase family protein [unclassified Burkholderia]NIE57783.1 recombinase family protein [Burkholderia sp. Ap-955]NIF10772.1 recombinase family protein [Burkholderia sp. Ax-1735]NIG02504.1 recombinase family protein [Burkholderia sp. Tr-849]